MSFNIPPKKQKTNVNYYAICWKSKIFVLPDIFVYKFEKIFNKTEINEFFHFSYTMLREIGTFHIVFMQALKYLSVILES